MDHAIFNDWCKQQLNNESLNDKEFKTEERLFTLEQKFDGMCSKEELKNQLKTKASNERFIELRENLHKLQVMSVSTQDKFEKEMKSLESSLGKKNAELHNYIQDMKIRLKTIEDEINDEDGDGNYASKDFSSTKRGP